MLEKQFEHHECSSIFEAALTLIEGELSRVLWNRLPHELYDSMVEKGRVENAPDPFTDHETAFRCNSFGVWGYDWRDWDDGRDQYYNFIHVPTDTKLTWYKRYPRGLSINKHVDAVLAETILENCLKELRDIDDLKQKKFLYGELEQVPYFTI